MTPAFPVAISLSSPSLSPLVPLMVSEPNLLLDNTFITSSTVANELQLLLLCLHTQPQGPTHDLQEDLQVKLHDGYLLQLPSGFQREARVQNHKAHSDLRQPQLPDSSYSHWQTFLQSAPPPVPLCPSEPPSILRGQLGFSAQLGNASGLCPSFLTFPAAASGSALSPTYFQASLSSPLPKLQQEPWQTQTSQLLPY